jgi:hypothetical protein
MSRSAKKSAVHHPVLHQKAQGVAAGADHEKRAEIGL